MTTLPADRPWLSVICPTAGERLDGLARLLDSLQLQGAAYDGVDVLVVADTHTVTAHPSVEALCEARGVRYLAHDGGIHAWGQPQRQAGIAQARGAWLWWLADDDIATLDSLAAIRQAILDVPEPTPLLFRFLAPWREVIWRPIGPHPHSPPEPVLVEGNIDASGIIVPNEPARLGVWTNRYQGDYDFAALTVQQYRRMRWVDAVVCIARPDPEHDWTRAAREVRAVAPSTPEREASYA